MSRNEKYIKIALAKAGTLAGATTQTPRKGQKENIMFLPVLQEREDKSK